MPDALPENRAEVFEALLDLIEGVDTLGLGIDAEAWRTRWRAAEAVDDRIGQTPECVTLNGRTYVRASILT